MKQKFLLALVVACVSSYSQTSRPKITRAADLPRFSYKIDGTIADLVKSEEKFRPLAAQIRKDIDSILAGYDIEDAAAKRRLLSALAALDCLEGKDADALGRLDEVKALEEKPAQKFMSGVEARAMLEARKAAPDRGSQEYRQAVYKHLRRQLDDMPYETVQNEVKVAKMRSEIVTEALIVGQVQARMDPIVAKSGALSSDFAHQLPTLRMVLVEVVPVKTAFTEAFAGYIAAHNKEKTDIWAARDVKLEPGKPLAPVPVAVWDSGVDTAIFRDQVVREGGKPALLAYDLHVRKTTGELYPMSADQARRLPEMKRRIKGLLDLQANIDSPEASEVKKVMTSLKPEQAKPFFEELQLFGGYAHGTHVAGILLAGNPYARLVIGRITFDHKTIPDPCPSHELGEKQAAAIADYVGFFKRHGVRVVNMSWGESLKLYEHALEQCGVGNSPQERERTARELFTVDKNALEKAIASAPDILFVAAAGNDNSDATFDEFIPSSIRLPNLLTVGAVDKAGDEAPFTSYGPTVVAHANGYEVDSYIPGGDRLKLSGTSMASPNAANLAAKILAVNPKLKPPEVIEIIRKTAEKSQDGRRFLIHPANAVAAAQR